VATHAAALAEEIFAFADHPADLVGDENHVGGVANLTARLVVSRGEDRPEPVFVVTVGFFNASGGASVALVARRAGELVGIVSLQEIRFRVAGKCAGVFVRFFAF
jgi:CBS domain-containing protein